MGQPVNKNYLDLPGLTEYDTLIKQFIANLKPVYNSSDESIRFDEPEDSDSDSEQSRFRLIKMREGNRFTFPLFFYID